MISQKELKAIAQEFLRIRPKNKIRYDHPWSQACRAVTRSLNSVNLKFDVKRVSQFLKLSGYDDVVVTELDEIVWCDHEPEV